MAVEVYMPKMSDHMGEGTIINWLVEEGSVVDERQPILEIETDKAVAEVEAPATGVLCGIRPNMVAGAVVPVGVVIGFVAQPGEEVPVLSPLEAPKGGDAAPGAQVASSALQVGEESGRILASPIARRRAKELGIDLRQVKGTGPRGRVKEEDVLAFVELQKERSPAAATDEDAEWVELNTVRRITGERMALSMQTAPHFVLGMDVDMTEAMRWREALMERIHLETRERLSYTALLVKIVASVLKRHPLANAEFSDGRIKRHRSVNIGVAVSGNEGLAVPVIRAADTKSLAEIVIELAQFREKASVSRFTPQDLSGGTFTITNLGMYGVDRFSAIINIPESAILAVGSIVTRPAVLRGGGIAPRPETCLTLSVDHRVLDGAEAAKFLGEIRTLLENPGELLQP